MISIRNKALQLLSRRDHSQKELQQKLSLAFPDTPSEEIESVLHEFIQVGWLSDARFAEQWVYFRSQRYGQQRLKHELYEKGIDYEIIAQVLADSSSNEEADARAILERKYAAPPRSTVERNKQLRFLLNKGFSLQVVYSVVPSVLDAENL